ncbi:hypothetical protein DVR12_18515 [Chitinophaga silvatica]|uniref:Uncharacterized protein n=1 Tax=Chitinophaga silvatica TaxID=2282649 RepID=A0A3E1Y6I7_9BACT|nr:hypothetical protein [Chitinophaga silvatica]RFS20556.1 hypothetical protein DVR12_18515 [Chitinophaga silvatica]
MKLKFKCLLFLLLPLCALASEPRTAYKKIISKNFTVDNNANFSVANKYGKIVFHTWNKNEIKATITVTGFGKSDSQAQANAESVDVNTEKSSSSAVVLRTVNGGAKGGGKGWFSWGGNSDSKGYVNIDYDIYVPQSLGKVTVENQFGDVIADKFTYPANLQLSYCTFDIRDAESLTMTLNYCDKGKLGSVKDARIVANYSTINAENIEQLDASSNYSNYYMDKVKNLKLVTTYSDYKIQSADRIDGTATYSDLKLQELQVDVNLKLTYSDLKVQKVSTSFKGADLSLSYSDVKLSLSRRQPLKIQANLTYGDLSLGDLEMKNVYYEKKATSLNYTGFAAGGNDNSPLLKVRGVNSDLKLSSY